MIGEHDVIAAEKQCGDDPMGIFLRRVLKGAVGVVVVTATFAVVNGILALSALSFLGRGPVPPAVNWGGMVTTAPNFISDGYWWEIF